MTTLAVCIKCSEPLTPSGDSRLCVECYNTHGVSYTQGDVESVRATQTANIAVLKDTGARGCTSLCRDNWTAWDLLHGVELRADEALSARAMTQAAFFGAWDLARGDKLHAVIVLAKTAILSCTDATASAEDLEDLGRCSVCQFAAAVLEAAGASSDDL